MAINCYNGLQGSGKSYEVVSGQIVDAIKAGRRVVTNIDGINETKIHEYIVKQATHSGWFVRKSTVQVDPAKLGQVIKVSNARIKEPKFFPDEEKNSWDTVVQPGDLVAIDEAWTVWGTSQGKLSDEHMQFFRMHRHYVHPDSGVACDVVLMTQDIAGLHRELKHVIELSFKMIKLKSVGLRSGYRVEMYDTYKQAKAYRLGRFNKFYRAAVFELYKSYSGAGGKEVAVDKRQNVLANKTLWVMIGLGVLCAYVAVHSVLSFFHRGHGKPSQGGTAVAAGMSSASGAVVPAGAPQSKFSETWRIAGAYAANGKRWVVVADKIGRFRVESPSDFSNAGIARVGTIDGETVTTFSGQLTPGATPAATPDGVLGAAK
jgi:zona occludens toxin